MAQLNYKLPGGERVFVRKPQYEFGWDWGPRFINMGIRKSVMLTSYPNKYYQLFSRLSDFEIANGSAKLKLYYGLLSYFNPDTFTVHVQATLNEKVVYESQEDLITRPSGENDSMLIILDDPQLWWPNGIGEKSPVYHFKFWATEKTTNRIIADDSTLYALCKIKLVRKKDKYGESFYFTVNGEKVFAKGANYIPDDSFNPGKNSVDLVKMAREANMNMIRVWGGGAYPDNDFYDACIKNGIMVWQDFMYACGMYPLNLKTGSEHAFQTERIGKYNNIAVWCGNNEIDEGWKNWGWQKECNINPGDSAELWGNYVLRFDSSLYNWVTNDGTNDENYIPTSPKYGWGRKESMTHGDSHYWGVWWGLEPIGKYEEKIPRFMSEFGMQAMPELSTLRKVIPDSAMNFNSPKFKNHQKHPTGFETLDHYLKEYLRIPDDMEYYAYATQILQAYALTTAIEAQRGSDGYCMGSLIWQLNDCWPVTSWSLIDYELKPKMGYWEVAKAFEPLHISIREKDDCIEIKLINDMLENVKGEVRMQIKDFDGKELWEKKMKANVKKGDVVTVYRLPKSILKAYDLNEIYFKASMEHNAQSLETFYHFVKPNQLKLPKPTFTVSWSDTDNNISVSTNVYAPFSQYDGFYFGHLERGIPKNFRIYDMARADEIIFQPQRIRSLNKLLQGK